MTLTGSAFTFNKKLWSIFLMNATLSAKLLLIAGIAIHTTTAYAQPSDNNNNNTDSSEVSAMNESVNLQNETTEQTTKQSTPQQQNDEVEVQRQKAEAELEAMLERERQLEAANEAEEAKIIEESNTQTETIIEPASDVVDVVKDIESKAEQLPEQVEALATEVVPEPLPAEPLTDTAAADEELDTMMTELSSTEQNASSFNVSSETTSTPYNFERPPLGSGDIFIPVTGDARVFAEFVDKLPAVVNYYTRLSELEVIEFYSESFGEPVSQERKRERLTVTYLSGDISTRVVISEQDEQQQVDVIQESF